MPEWVLSKREHRGYVVEHIKSDYFYGATPGNPNGRRIKRFWWQKDLEAEGRTFKECADDIDRKLARAHNTGTSHQS